MDQGLGVLVWSPLAGGLLSGKYRRNHQAPVGSRQLSDWGEPPVYDPEGLYDIVEILIGIAEQHEVSAAQVALAWTLGRPGVTSLVIGARTGDQLADNLEAASLTAHRARNGPGSTRPAPRRSSTPTGIRPRPPATGSRPPT